MNAAATPTAWSDLFGTILPIVGLVSVLFTFLRVLEVLEQEFAEDDKLIKDPLGHIVSATITFDKFKEQGWGAFAALWAAMRFREFHKRFHPLLNPKQGVITFVIVMGTLAVLYALARNQAGPIVQGSIGVVATFVAAFWRQVVEHGKTLKKSADRLRIN